MGFTTNDFRGEAYESIGFSDCSGLELYNLIKETIIVCAEENGIPISTHEDTFKSGGFIGGTKVPLLLINHPDSSCKYFTIGMYVIGNTVFFPLLGKSAEQYKYNMREMNQNKGNFLQAALNRPDEIKIQQELQWQYNVLCCMERFFG